MKTADRRFVVYVHPGDVAELVAVEGVRARRSLARRRCWWSPTGSWNSGFDEADLVLAP
jgi:hypothetical protein